MAKAKSAKSDSKKKSRTAVSVKGKSASRDAAARRPGKKLAPRVPGRKGEITAKAADGGGKPRKGSIVKLSPGSSPASRATSPASRATSPGSALSVPQGRKPPVHGRPIVAEPQPKDRSGKVARPVGRRIKNAELQRIRSMLAQKKLALTSHIQAELSELEKPEKRHRADLEEMASDTHDTDSLCEIMDIEASQIDQIDMALAKIDNGTYGVCEDCGGEIPLARLEALPFATQCVDCKRKAEFEGQISGSDSGRLG